MAKNERICTDKTAEVTEERYDLGLFTKPIDLKSFIFEGSRRK